MHRFPTESLLERAERLLPHARVLRPAAGGPQTTHRVPAIIMHHGCGSPDGPQPDYAAALVDAGIACLIVDSYRPRDVSRAEAVGLVCTGARLWGRERAGDFLAMLAWARDQDWVDPDRLGGAGWSHGGWTIMDALALGPEIGRHAGLIDLPTEPLAGLSHVCLVYPWCGPGSHTLLRGWQRPCNGLMLLGAKDTLAGTALPKRALARARRAGGALDLHVFPGATHSFDERQSVNPTFRFDPEQTQAAITMAVQRAVLDLKP